MLCFLLLRLGSMSPSSGRDRQHAFLKQEAQRKFVTLPAARRIECDLIAAVHESAIGTKRTYAVQQKASHSIRPTPGSATNCSLRLLLQKSVLAAPA